MKEIKSDNYSVWIGQDALSDLDISSYSKVAILVDENTKRDCLKKLPKITDSLIIEIKFLIEAISNENYSYNKSGNPKFAIAFKMIFEELKCHFNVRLVYQVRLL